MLSFVLQLYSTKRLHKIVDTLIDRTVFNDWKENPTYLMNLGSTCTVCRFHRLCSQSMIQAPIKSLFTSANKAETDIFLIHRFIL